MCPPVKEFPEEFTDFISDKAKVSIVSESPVLEQNRTLLLVTKKTPGNFCLSLILTLYITAFVGST